MGFISRIKNFGKSVKAMTEEQTERNRGILQSLYQYFTAGLPVVTYQNLQAFVEHAYERNASVYSVVDWVAGKAAAIPLVVQVKKGDKWEVAGPSHPLQQVIDRPNPYETGTEQRHLLYTFYLVTGNLYLYSPRIPQGPHEGQATELWSMPAQHTEIVSDGWMQPVSGYKINVGRGHNIKLAEADVMHLKTPNLTYEAGQSLYGMSPLRAGLLALERSNSNYTAASTAFKTSGMAGIITEEKANDFTPTLTAEQQAEEEERLQDNYMGVLNYGKTMVTNAKIEYTKLGLSPVDLALIDDQKATLRDFCNIYKVSSTLFNDNESSTYNNVKEAKKSGYEDAILPLVDSFLAKFTAWLIDAYGGPEEVRIIRDTSGVAVLQEDRKLLAEWTDILVKGGAITRRKQLELLGLEADEADPMLDVRTVPLNIVPLSDITLDPTIETEAAAKLLGKHYLEK